MSLPIRELRPTDLDAFASLCVARGLEPDVARRRAEQVLWTAFENPEADGNPCYFVATDGERLVGHLGRMPTLFQMDGYREVGSFIHDLFVHPEVRARGRGFFTSMDLYRAAEKACPSFAVLVWTNEINIRLQKVRKYEQRWVYGYSKPLCLDAKIDRSVPIAPLASAGKAAVRAAIHAADIALAAINRSDRAIERVEAFDDRFDRLADRLAPTLGICPVKSRRYLEWKYAGWPHQHWECFAVASGADLLGFAVVVDSDTAPVCTIAELVAEPEDTATLRALVQASIHHCRGTGRRSLAAMATDPRFTPVLERHLFLHRPPKQPLFLAMTERARNPDLLRRPTAWHLSYGDSEGAL